MAPVLNEAVPLAVPESPAAVSQATRSTAVSSEAAPVTVRVARVVA